MLGAVVAVNLLDAGYAPYRGLFAVNIALVLGLWLVLPWSRGHRGRRLASPAFLVATFALGLTGSAGTHVPLTLLAIANVAFVFGMRMAAAILAGQAALMSAIPLAVGRPMADVLREVGFLVVFAAFVLGMVASVLRARQLAERVRELTVAQERGRMAAEMHDSIGHHLTVIKMGLENAERFRDRRPEAAWDEVRQAKELTAAALADARRWVRALRPLALDGHLGSAALERLADSFSGTGVAVSFDVTGTERLLGPDTELVLYRVLQEGLTNALRHAGARFVRGSLAFEKGKVVLVVADDGKGHGQGRGFGLSSLAERVEALGGTLSSGNAARGFELRAELPA
ncbi:sensor histidine kinase [Nonomuraea rhodomycinica]|uniref:histidine kinase n=1 Tax=Nonomuraea rhodomycinica TaxID=1712872 RepID=A0A7Y6MBX4_9ACTN|nr:sensor histidine kinase [Nonomuraea rhodomycinica]NUW40939.1 sensor histidine kinase [Nonomuraea rhodomycinica]